MGDQAEQTTASTSAKTMFTIENIKNGYILVIQTAKGQPEKIYCLKAVDIGEAIISHAAKTKITEAGQPTFHEPPTDYTYTFAANARVTPHTLVLTKEIK